MIRLAQFSIRRPKLALAFWGTFAAILVAIGLGVSDRLSPTMTFVPGTESTRAEDLAESQFGPQHARPDPAHGASGQLDRQGPPLVRALKRRDDTRVLSAWDAGEAGEAMRPSRTEAMILASVARTEEQMVDRYQRSIDKTVDAYTSAPVRSHTSGTPTLDRAIEDEALHTTRVATLLALPILFLALLIILRAPLAALVTTVFGGVVAFSGFGAMTIVGKALRRRRDRDRADIGNGPCARNRPRADDPHALSQGGGRDHRGAPRGGRRRFRCGRQHRPESQC